MKTFLNKYKFALLFIIIFVVVLVIAVTNNKKKQIIIPTPIPVKLELLNISPPEGIQEIVISNLAIHFSFSVPIDLESSSITIKPDIEFNIESDNKGKTILIAPSKDWIFDTKYQITVSPTSTDGQTLEDSIKYTFAPTLIKESNMDERPLR